MTRKVLGSLILVMALLLAGCRGGAGREPTSPPPAKATNTPAAFQPTAEAEEYNFDQASDLSALNSYRTHYTFNWEGTKAGQQEVGSWEALEQFVRQPLARRVLWTTTSAGQTANFEFIQVGKDLYMNSGAGWIVMTSTETDIFKDSPFLGKPFDVISGNRGTLAERDVLVNGVSTNHYTFDESTLGADLGLGAIAKARGDVWVSPESKVVVKYVVHYEGKNLVIGGSEEGRLDLAFDLMDINKPITIVPPAGVKPPLPADIPIPDDVTKLTAVSGAINYKTSKSVEEVTAYYEAQMPASGWTKGQSGVPGMMSFTKGDRTAQIVVQAEAGTATVTIMLGE